ncbi:MAG: hypothetical protein EXS58_02050 [Candidatus Latescibacteria bacterium]|nr:hypothetical protein [Candidatus Latescibacterota bacterium]
MQGKISRRLDRRKPGGAFALDGSLVYHSAEEVVCPSNEINLRMCAKAGKVWITTADSSHPIHLPCSAPSGFVDPEGNWAARTEDRGEQLLCHTVELEP